MNHTQHFLEGAPPAVFTLQLVWESQREDGAVISDTMDALEETVDLGVHSWLPESTAHPQRHRTHLDRESDHELDLPLRTAAGLDYASKHAPHHAGEVFLGIGPGLHCYRLRCMVCYYGEHYQALILLPAMQRWVLFDDAHVSPVGSWADVRRK